ncbi:MAG: hypothetical protein C0484_08125 [Rhodospirillum sp.]|nr:hypothetical protein [Rhodospirillum sp.]
MLAHLLTSAVRSLAVTVVLGCILIYAIGGLDSPNAHGMVGVIAVCFFLFWITFFFMFGPRVPTHDGGREESHLDSASHLALRHRRRETDHTEGGPGESETGGGSD